MRGIKLRKGYIAGLLALVVAISGVYLSSTYAAGRIDTSKPCTLTISVDGSGSYSEDLKAIDLKAKLYKVATVTEGGVYKTTDAFNVDTLSPKIEDLKGTTEEWKTASSQAAQIVTDNNLTEDASFEIKEGTGTSGNLTAGMYLVMVDKGLNDLYEYNFTPYIIALPDNLYFQTGNAADDAWVYDAAASLKPEQSPRYGDLRVDKVLTRYNTTLGEAVFVFDIEGVDASGKVVYSNVVSTKHTAAGTVSAVAEHIPAGTVITVTEKYTGASYTLDSAASAETTIIAEDVVSVEFSNSYNGSWVPGTGVTNHFDYNEDGGWQWSQLDVNNTVVE